MGVTGSPPAPSQLVRLRRRRRVTMLRSVPLLELAAMALAASVALLWALWLPPVRDLAGQLFRAREYEAIGPALWNNLWYGGHHTPGYGALTPPVVALLGAGATGVLAATAAAGCFAALLRSHAGAAAWPGALWLGAATTTSLFTGRLPFALGTALGIGACLAAQHRRTALAAVLGVAAGAASGVAAAFVALAGLATAIGGATARRRRQGLTLAAAPALTMLALSRLFPVEGYATFGPVMLAATIASGLAIFVAASPADRVVRAGALLFVAGCILAYLLPNPMGGTAGRLAALVAGPLLLTLVLARHRAGTLPGWAHGPAGIAVAATGLVLAAGWQWGPARLDVHDAVAPAYAPSTREAFYAPLIAEIERRSDGPVRVEVAFTATHYEALWLARRIPIARGWQRQIDRARNPLFYEGRLDAARYERWLRENGIAWVALPIAPLDHSAKREARVIRSRPRYLREAWRSPHWRLYRVLDSPGLIDGPARLVRLGADAFALEAHRPGRILVRVRHTRYWRVVAGRACVARAPSGFTEVRARRPGRIRVAARLGPATRLGAQPQCEPGR